MEFRVAKPDNQFRKLRQCGIKPQVRVAGDQCDAHLIFVDRSDVHLSAVGPVNLDEIRPGVTR